MPAAKWRLSKNSWTRLLLWSCEQSQICGGQGGEHSEHVSARPEKRQLTIHDQRPLQLTLAKSYTW